MTEIATFKKNKIELTDYDYTKDVQNRILMASFTPQEVEVLEEILYSSLRIPQSILEQNLSISTEKMGAILKKLSRTGLFEIKDDFVLVDKEMRKYYEKQILKFEEDFKPNMEYAQGLLKNVPIHILPTWYAISRTADNIFESIIEKTLLTPQIYQRYLTELHLSHPVQRSILNELYKSPHYEIEADSIKKKFNLSQDEFEEHLLFLEFSFAACIQYKKKKDIFVEVVTPFHEWQEYLLHVRDTEPNSIIDDEKIQRLKSDDFAVVNEMSALLELMQAQKLSVETLEKKCPEFDREDFDYYLHKLSLLNLVQSFQGKWSCTSDGMSWLQMKPLDQAIYIYRHPLNTIKNPQIPEELCNHKTIRDAEKCLSRLQSRHWFLLDEFLKGVYIPLKPEQHITLEKQGRTWHYQLPEYTKKELLFFKFVITRWLFDVGLIALGTLDGQECFCLTEFGLELFDDE